MINFFRTIIISVSGQNKTNPRGPQNNAKPAAVRNAQAASISRCRGPPRPGWWQPVQHLLQSQCWRREGKRQPGCERGRKASFWKHQISSDLEPRIEPETQIRTPHPHGHFKASKTMCPFSLLGLARIMQTKPPTGCPCYGHSTSPAVWFSHRPLPGDNRLSGSPWPITTSRIPSSWDSSILKLQGGGSLLSVFSKPLLFVPITYAEVF